MNEHRSTYRQITKATTLFGGVQAFQIIITIVRSKFVAILLGPTGMGIVGLLTSTTGLITGLTNFGLGTSAVKDISEANGTQDEKRISTVINVMRKLVWLTGILGSVMTLVLSPVLSQMTFGNKEYTIAFAWLSITLLFNQLSTGQLVLLQGLRRIQELAKANLFGSLIGLFITIPIYYILGIKGIVPVIIITSITSLLLSWHYSKKIKVIETNITKELVIKEGKSMMTMGVMISLTGMIGLSFAYLIRIYITRIGGVSETGFFTAGFAIINTYVAMIFSAFESDFYPRLSSIAKDNKVAKLAINQQSEIAILILAPILMLFLVFVKWAIIILYSKEFLAIHGMLQWAAIGVFFRTISWAIAIILLAKGEGRVFFWNELIGNTYTFTFSILGYYFWGLTGIGFAYMISYLIYTLQVFFLAKIKYGFSFTTSFLKVFTILFGLAALCSLLINISNEPINYLIGVLLIIISTWYSYKTLNLLIGIGDLIQSFKNKFRKNN